MNTALSNAFYRVRKLLIPYLLLLSGSLTLYFSLSKEHIFHVINGFHTIFLDSFFSNLTYLGDAISCVIISIFLFLMSRRKGLLMSTSYLLTAALTQFLKSIFDAPRPKLYFENTLNGIYFVPGVNIHTAYSFPSGHTVSIFTAATVFTYISRKKSWGIVFLIIALLVGYSRMYLSQHFLEDVIFGSVIGVFVTTIWLSWIDTRSCLQQEKWSGGLFKKNGAKD
ncbi:MAG: phosphatase PAP2 family protein [Sphingobacteriaceae bacterium]